MTFADLFRGFFRAEQCKREKCAFGQTPEGRSIWAEFGMTPPQFRPQIYYFRTTNGFFCGVLSEVSDTVVVLKTVGGPAWIPMETILGFTVSEFLGCLMYLEQYMPANDRE